MTRAISLACLALLMIFGASPAFAAPRQSIAVLGLEVVDPSGTPTAQDTQVAKDLTDGLRSRAKAGTSQYQLATASDKELIDQKLLNNCDTEAAACMSAIGNQLGADVLMYGNIKKDGKQYVVTLKVLDVGTKKMLKTTTDPIPLSESTGAALQGWAKKLYAKLTGESSGGTIVIRVANADRGTILINGEEKGSISSGTGTVSGLPEGKVRVAVESDGFHRWEKDVTVTSGTQTVQAELEKGGPDIGPTGPTGPTGPEGPTGPTGPTDTTTRGSAMWKGLFVGAVLISGGGIGLGVYGNGLRDQARDDLCAGGAYDGMTDSKGGTCPTQDMIDMARVDELNDKGDKGKLFGRVGAGVAIAAGGFAILAFYKGFFEKNSTSGKEHAERGHRVRRDRLTITPVIAPSGAGATLRLDW